MSDHNLDENEHPVSNEKLSTSSNKKGVDRQSPTVNEMEPGTEKPGKKLKVVRSELAATTHKLTAAKEASVKKENAKATVKKTPVKESIPPVIKENIPPIFKESKTSKSSLPAVAKEAKPTKPATTKVSAKSKNAVLQKITFQVKFHTKVGQSLVVTGNHPLLGGNSLTHAFELEYLDNNYWHGTLVIPAKQRLTEPVTYRYQLKGTDGVLTAEWGDDKIIDPSSYNTPEIHLIDTWNYSGFIENTFYTEPFKNVLLKPNHTPLKIEEPDVYTHIFKVKAPLLLQGQVVCLIGSVPELGSWDTGKPLLLSKKEFEDWYSIKVNIAEVQVPLYYKYGIYDVNENRFVRYEEGEQNRYIPKGNAVDKLTIVSDGFLVVPANGFKGAGVAIPVFSLRSENGLGVGEFNDLKLMVDWAKAVGLKLVQILPVNDTTATYTKADSYPYAAISAFALHPLYLHLPGIVNKKTNELLAGFTEVQSLLNAKSEVDYVSVMEAKWSFVETIFPLVKKEIFRSSAFKSFYADNEHWLAPYAVFCYFRNKYKSSDFTQWPSNQTYNEDEIIKLASSPLKAADEISINYFVQYHLHLQLKEATEYAHANGIILKGDIPIGIYRYSCDAWQQPHLYNMEMQAGAPPDDFAVKGQNWGFPTYNWLQMQHNGFEWWKQRFKQMSYYFDAFRIDHILGFFRIWSIPTNAVEGIMGHFVPALPVHIDEFYEKGIEFDYNRFCKPFINDAVLSEIFGNNIETIKSDFLRQEGEGVYVLEKDFDTQKKVEAYFASKDQTAHDKKIKEGLFDLISNVILFEEGSGKIQFHFRISVEHTSSFRYLDGGIQHKLRELYINYFFRRQNGFWQQEAMKKLPELKRSTNMLICGEDLGMVPDCVEGVMKTLAILSLEIQRMPKDPARVFFHPNDAPYLSVVTPSTHDMSTIRGWWEEDRGITQKFFNNELGQWGTAPFFCEPWINRIVINQHLYSPAMWSIFQLQDLLGISENLRIENPNDERINIPADPKHYWKYRMHLTLEELLKHSGFIAELKGAVEQSGR